MGRLPQTLGLRTPSAAPLPAKVQKIEPTLGPSKMKTFGATVFALALAACANSSGVLEIGPDTFTISTSASPGKGGIPAAKRIAYQEDTAECNQRGLKVFALSEKTSSPTWTEGMASMELNFRCLGADDVEFQRQKLQSTPDKILEIRQK